mmetsp:Transcript_8402/g.37132  ORF Transcript_8402/g.37132 Transcript_8402/m.37132 type:complete len:270 (-) Transcript_8402:1224-2033(-)
MYGGYDGSATQFAGDGFMPTPTGATGAATGAAGGRGQGRPDSLVPVTVKMLQTAIAASNVDDGLRVNGEEVHNITLLGKIIKASDTATNQVYTLDDGTGTVVVKQWVDADDADASSRKDELVVGKYARVYGHVKQFGSDTSVVAFSVRPVQDHNEVTYHFLEAVYCNSHNAQRADAKPAAGTGTAYAAPSSAPTSAPAVDPGGSCVDQAKAIFEGPDGRRDEGVKIDVVVQQLNGRFTEAQVREAVEHLVNEGHLYSTIDDDHFKSTNL